MVIGGEQGDQGNHEAGQSRGQPWPGSNPGDQGHGGVEAPSLAQIQEWDRSPPQPIAADRLKASTPGEGAVPLRCVLQKGLAHATFGVPNGAKKDTRSARWPAVQYPWLPGVGDQQDRWQAGAGGGGAHQRQQQGRAVQHGEQSNQNGSWARAASWQQWGRRIALDGFILETPDPPDSQATGPPWRVACLP